MLYWFHKGRELWSVYYNSAEPRKVLVYRGSQYAAEQTHERKCRPILESDLVLEKHLKVSTLKHLKKYLKVISNTINILL